MRADLKSPLKFRLLVLVPAAVIEIAEGIVTLLTLTVYRPSWSFKFCAWSVTRSLKKKIARGVASGV